METGIVDYRGTRSSGRREERVNPGRSARNRKGDVRHLIGTRRHRHVDVVHGRAQIIMRGKTAGVHTVSHHEIEVIWPAWDPIGESKIGFCRDAEKTLRPRRRFQPIGQAQRLIAGEGESGINRKCIVLIEYRSARGKQQ